MRYIVTLMNVKGDQTPDPNRKIQTSMGLAIAHAHRLLDNTKDSNNSAVIKELDGNNKARLVKVVTRRQITTRLPTQKSRI
jgi:hypothetical protein